MLARSNVVLAGYWDQPEADRRRDRRRLVPHRRRRCIDDDGYLVISDRKKDVIITGGENVSSIEVEDCLFSHPASRRSRSSASRREVGRDVKALVVVAPGADVTEEELIAHCRERLARYKCPTRVEFRDDSPGPPPASCRSSSCAPRTGRAASARSTDRDGAPSHVRRTVPHRSRRHARSAHREARDPCSGSARATSGGSSRRRAAQRPCTCT